MGSSYTELRIVVMKRTSHMLPNPNMISLALDRFACAGLAVWSKAQLGPKQIRNCCTTSDSGYSYDSEHWDPLGPMGSWAQWAINPMGPMGLLCAQGLRVYGPQAHWPCWLRGPMGPEALCGHGPSLYDSMQSAHCGIATSHLYQTLLIGVLGNPTSRTGNQQKQKHNRKNIEFRIAYPVRGPPVPTFGDGPCAAHGG